METVLPAEDGQAGEAVPVRLHAHVTEIGTLELWCNGTRDPRRWKLEFNVRETSEDHSPSEVEGPAAERSWASSSQLPSPTTS